MAENLFEYMTFPIGAALLYPEDYDSDFLSNLNQLSPALLNFISSPATAAYIRGLIRSVRLPIERAPRLAFVILRVVLGEVKLDGMSGVLQQELGVSPEVATRMAQDIEQELFAPIKGDLSTISPQQSMPKDDLGLGEGNQPMPNTLDLREPPAGTS